MKADNLLELLKECSLPEAMASLSVAMVKLAIATGIPKETVLIGVEMSYDQVAVAAGLDISEEDKTCH